MSTSSRSISVHPFSQYYTYQADFQLFPRDTISNDEGFAKSILYVIDWIRGKVKSPEPFLAAYPGISDFRSFSTDEIRDQDQSQGFDIRIAFDSKRSIWALRFFEFSNNPEVPGQSFVTEVTVSKESGSVMMAIRTTCREPVGSPPARVFRLWYIRHGLMQDEDLILTEAYTDRQYPISGKPIIVNGKSKDSCSHFSENLLLNSRRQFPLILVTDPKKYDAYKDIFDEFAYYVTAHAHVVVLSGGHNKLAYSVLKQRELGDALKDESLAFALIEAYPDISADNLEPKYYYHTGSDEDLSELLDSVKDELINYHRGSAYDYFGAEFYSTVKVNKIMALVGDGGDFDREALEATISEQLEQLATAQESESNLTVELQKKQRDYDNLNKKYNKALSDLEKSDMNQSDSYRELESRLQQMSDALEAEKKKNRELSKPFTDEHGALLTIPATNNRDAILQWIEDSYCGDDGCLIIHDRAKDSFRKDSTNRDFRRICLMFHFLNGFTRIMNEGNDPVTASKKASYFDILDNRFEVTRASKSDGAFRLYRDDYLIDISAFDPGKKKVLLEYHLKKGKGMDTDSVRIYFYYDSDIGKSIIGYMPDHLPM